MGSVSHLAHLQPSPSFDSTPDSAISEGHALINETRSVWDGITSRIRPEDASWENVILPLLSKENAGFERERILKFYASTSPSKELRDASNRVTTMLNGAEVDLFVRRDMFVLVDAVMKRCPPQDSQSQYYLAKLHRRFADNGCAITDVATRNSFSRQVKRMSALVQECNKNRHEEDAGLWLSEDDLAGVPSSHMKRLKRGEGDNEGMIWLPTKLAMSNPALSNAKREATRRRIGYAVANSMMANVPLFRELILLRDSTARMLGYKNHFELRTSGKMVQNPATVERLMSEIRSALDSCAFENATELMSLKQMEDRDDLEHPETLFSWDMAYLKKRWNDQQDGGGGATLDEYFELDCTLNKLLDMAEHLFGAKFAPVEVDAKERVAKHLVWHEDVRMYQIWDVDSASEQPVFLGHGYLDLYPREGKYTHAGHYGLTRGYEREDGTRFYPSSAVVMNYPYSPDQPTLLTLNQVRQLFHELGHLLHSLFTSVKHASLHFVDRDFVEAPSLMYEQFFWNVDNVKALSHHYSHIERWKPFWLQQQQQQQQQPLSENEDLPLPPLQLSDEGAAALVKQNYRAQRATQVNDFFFTMYDMEIHCPETHEELEKMNFTELFNKMHGRIHHTCGGEAIGDGWEWGHGEARFRNVINNYDAGYYAYLLGRMCALDIFKTGFGEGTISKEAGRRYRDMVLRVGGGQPEMKTLVDYLGHEPSTKSYLAWLCDIRPHPR